jgi:ribosomal protein S18 acetylase RimI-like enzyme
MIKKWFLCLLCLLTTTAWSDFVFIDKSGDAVTIEWVDQASLNVEESLFFRGLWQAYSNISPQELGVEDKSKHIKELFETVKSQFTHKIGFLACAKVKGNTVGFICYKPTEMPDQLYISQICIDPDYWGKGIGSELIFCGVKRFPNTRSIVTNFHKSNHTYSSFVRAVGFKQSNFLIQGLDSNKYVGMEWNP